MEDLIIERQIAVGVGSDVPQEYTVAANNEEQWIELHTLLTKATRRQYIPNRVVECVSDYPFSKVRGCYKLSENEVEELKNHPHINWIQKDGLFNPNVIEQARLDVQHPDHIPMSFGYRFGEQEMNVRYDANLNVLSGAGLTYTHWGLIRHSSKTNQFIGVGTTARYYSDLPYSLTGKNVDIVVVDTGVHWAHPEFLKPGYNSVPVGVGTSTVTRVKDILLHGPDEFGFTWAGAGLTEPGTGSLANYTIARALEGVDGASNTFGSTAWHGSTCASMAAGNRFGYAYEANIWSIAASDRADIGFADTADAFDYVAVWHDNKPINPETGVKNPTIMSASFGYLRRIAFQAHECTSGGTLLGPINTALPAVNWTASFRNVSYGSTTVRASQLNVPAINPGLKTDLSTVVQGPIGGKYYRLNYYTFNSALTSARTKLSDLLDERPDIIWVQAAANNYHKSDIPEGSDYNNLFTPNANTATLGSGDEYYYNRPGSPPDYHRGLPDAVINVGNFGGGMYDDDTEAKWFTSNSGPAIDVWTSGSYIIGPTYATKPNSWVDPRSVGTGVSFYLGFDSGTSFAAPFAAGLVALYAQTKPNLTRVDARNWVLNQASVGLSTSLFYEGEPESSAVAAGSSLAYWSDLNGLRGAPRRVLYNPFANADTPKITGLNITGLNIKQQ